MKEQKVVYYRDENTDDFVSKDYTDIKIDEKYQYLHKNLFWNVASFILYRIIATPIAYLYLKLKFRIQFVGREKLKTTGDKGYFLYVNHTQMIGDAFLPTIATFYRKAYVIVHPDNVSIPFWGHFIKMLGPLPLPSNVQAWKNFVNAIDKIIEKKQVVTIYPEAHVWNYYTGIRNYSDATFRYPAKDGADCFAATVTYQKRRKSEKPRMVVYIDGPFQASNSENLRMRQEELRDKVYNVMCERAKNSNVEYIKYEKIKEEVFD
ncbi:MAG: 1-acyl-sn-glycerol-3-phosphate acyltransferase [Clostridia bacterium]|nr:1-acyl-sn-glycerol-3-phosphate acyltransferase [Clostridia bacterium]